jgi:glycosyltransferase involved in cell wall biosynthesis
MNQEETLVSVVLCTYNGEAYLKEQLNTLLRQTYTALEIVIIDDGSTDNTCSIIEKMAKQDARISYSKNLHQLGYNKNYEKALKLVKGSYIAIADQDDIWQLNKIEILLGHLNNSHAAMVYCHSEDFVQSLPTLKQPCFYSGRIQYFEGTDSRKLFLRNSVSGHCMLFRKEILPPALPFDKGVFYDLWLAVVACANGGVQFCPETLVFRRRHARNASLLFLSAQQQGLNPYQFLVPIIHKAITAPNLPLEAKIYGHRLSQLLSFSRRGVVNWRLLIFIIQHRRIVFYYKPKKASSFFSHLKHSFFIAQGYLLDRIG